MDRYHSVRLVGQGTYGKVYLARERSAKNRFVALKHFVGGRSVSCDAISQSTPKKEADPTVPWDAIRELSAYRLLIPHPNILRLWEIFETDCGQTVAVLEGMQRTLEVHYSQCDPGELSKRDHARQIENAIGHLHAHSICHRDLKPSNILVHDGGRVCVADLGHAAVCRPGYCLTLFAGTAWYRAPEVALGLPYDMSADLWSLGCVYVWMVCGAHLFAYDTDDLIVAHRSFCMQTSPFALQAAGVIPELRQVLQYDPERRVHPPQTVPKVLVDGPATAPALAMTHQTDIDLRMRAILVLWLIEVAGHFALSDPALERTIELLDAMLSHAVVSRSRLQMLGCACLLIASKAESGAPIGASELVVVVDNAFTASDLKDEERRVLVACRYDIWWPLTHLKCEYGWRRMLHDLWLLSRRRHVSDALERLDRICVQNTLPLASVEVEGVTEEDLERSLKRRHASCYVQRVKHLFRERALMK